MRWFLLAAPLLVATNAYADVAFLRALPEENVCAALTAPEFAGADAVIILRERAYTVQEMTITYRENEYQGSGLTTTDIMIAKVFADAGVKALGSFELEYAEPFGEEFPTHCDARARVRKPDGTIVVMPATDVQVMVSEADRHGDVLARKVVFKVPDLAAGDVVQIESTLTEKFRTISSGIFQYQSRYPTLACNLAVTCPGRDRVTFFSFPEERVGPPHEEQIATGFGAGKTHFWSLRNLNAIPEEAFAYPFEALSILTAFVVDRRLDTGYRGHTDWATIGKQFWDDWVRPGSVGVKEIRRLGFREQESSVDFTLVDSLYTALRHAITLHPTRRLYPRCRQLHEVLEDGRGSASDAACIFYKILGQWKVDARASWVRDRRKGDYEATVPSSLWFDRIGVLVRIGESTRLYDFDRAIAAHYELPWFLNPLSLPVIGREGCEQLRLAGGGSELGWVREEHVLSRGQGTVLRDSLRVLLSGAPAERLRESTYELRGPDLEEKLRATATSRCLAATDVLTSSDILDQPDIEILASGESSAAAMEVDSFLSVRPANQSIRGFRDALYSRARVNDIVLDEPMVFETLWLVRPPDGFTKSTMPPDTMLVGPGGTTGFVAWKDEGGAVRVIARLECPQPVIAAEGYSGLMGLLDRLLAHSEQAIVFRRKA